MVIKDAGADNERIGRLKVWYIRSLMNSGSKVQDYQMGKICPPYSISREKVSRFSTFLWILAGYVQMTDGLKQNCLRDLI